VNNAKGAPPRNRAGSPSPEIPEFKRSFTFPRHEAGSKHNRHEHKMAKEKNATSSFLVRELFNLHIYKRSQGRIARQVTFAALLLGVLLAAWRLSVFGSTSGHVMELAVPGVVALVGTWIVFRLVNMPSFADFLIAVEAEMNKVSWPTRAELWRSSIVVILLIIFLSAVLFGYDVFWSFLRNQVIGGG
jgi:preprotein translocase subunit SecE